MNQRKIVHNEVEMLEKKSAVDKFRVLIRNMSGVDVEKPLGWNSRELSNLKLG
jgi:hypothetical protein